MIMPRHWSQKRAGTEREYESSVIGRPDAIALPPPPAPCSCGDPQHADVYLEGVIGRGNQDTGTETEELSEFRCREHVLSRAGCNAMLAAVTDEGTSFYGPWRVIELRRRALRRSTT
jgi:hypothetical protein